jgi:hypothetical protein
MTQVTKDKTLAAPQANGKAGADDGGSIDVEWIAVQLDKLRDTAKSAGQGELVYFIEMALMIALDKTGKAPRDIRRAAGSVVEMAKGAE